MTKTIEISDDVFVALQDRADPLVDDMNSVLRKVLHLDDTNSEPVPAGSDAVRVRPRRGSLLAASEYEMPLLQTLAAADRGWMAASRATSAVYDRIKHQLTELDHGCQQSGQERWRNRLAQVRLTLIRTGDMAQGSPHGIWEITDKGRSRVESASG